VERTGAKLSAEGKGGKQEQQLLIKKFRVSVVMHFPQTRPQRAYSLPLAWSRQRASAAGVRVDLPGPWTEHGLEIMNLDWELLGK